MVLIKSHCSKLAVLHELVMHSRQLSVHAIRKIFCAQNIKMKIQMAMDIYFFITPITVPIYGCRRRTASITFLDWGTGWTFFLWHLKAPVHPTLLGGEWSPNHHNHIIYKFFFFAFFFISVLYFQDKTPDKISQLQKQGDRDSETLGK